MLMRVSLVDSLTTKTLLVDLANMKSRKNPAGLTCCTPVSASSLQHYSHHPVGRGSGDADVQNWHSGQRPHPNKWHQPLFGCGHVSSPRSGPGWHHSPIRHRRHPGEQVCHHLLKPQCGKEITAHFSVTLMSMCGHVFVAVHISF